MIDEERGWALETLQICGCGDPDKTIMLARDVLGIIKRRWDATQSLSILSPSDRPAFEAAGREERDALGLRLGDDSDLYWLTLYWLDACDLTEHGGSVGGCWLTPAGEAALGRLQAMDLPGDGEGTS
jgi:hypothetical protein